VLLIQPSRARCRDGAGRGLAGSHLQRGMLRHLFLIIDMTRAMDSTDIKPNRAVSVAKVAQVREAAACVQSFARHARQHV